MSKNTKLYKWVDNNIKNIDNSKTVLVIGSTGSIGSYLCDFLSYKGAKLIIAGRNSSALNDLKDKLTKKYNNDIKTLIIDYANINTVNEALNELEENLNVDIIINNAGIYHQPKKDIYGFDQTYLINYLMPVYFFEHITNLDKFKNIKIINVASVSYRYHELDYNDFTGENRKSKTARYSSTKRLLMYYSNYLKKYKNINTILAHPGVSTTNLFSKKNKAYPKIFYIVCVPIMKVLFMKPIKASLSLLKAIDTSSVNLDEWVGPRGLLHSWGYPNIQKIHGDIMDENQLKKVYERTMLDLKELNK